MDTIAGFSLAVGVRPIQTSPLITRTAFCGCRRPCLRSPPRRCRARRAPAQMAAPTSSGDRLLWADGLTNSHDGSRFQFRDVSLTIARGAKIGLLGANGSGKSTLLHVLAGLHDPDAGKVHVKRGAHLALVSQDLPETLDDADTVLDSVLSLAAKHTSAPAVRAAIDYARAIQNADTNPDNLTRAAVRMEDVPGAWEIDAHLDVVLSRLELPRDARLGALSGGQKRRVGIAAALVSRPAILLLDEVTNHLSIEGITFLEEILKDPSLTVLCISHDRYFLDAVCSTALWDLDGELVRYGPGYSEFLEAKAARVESERRQVVAMASTFRRELEWIRRQPKARGTKSKSRIEDFEKLQQTLKEKRNTLRGERTVRAISAASARLGGDIVAFENVTLRRGDTLVLKDFSYTFERGERVGICGGNGVGKSSIINALMGNIPLESGRITVGETVVFGHYDQNGIDVGTPLSEATAAILAGRSRGKDSEMRVVDFVGELVSLFGTGGNSAASATSSNSSDDAEARLDAKIAALSHSVALSKPTGRAATAAAASQSPIAYLTPIGLLDHFGFQKAQHHAFVSRLSGGERRRLLLMSLFLRNPNMLLLDEISNDLDIDTLSMVEDLLVGYSGVLVMVSHDRFMLDRLVDHLLIVEGNGEVSLVEGKFTDYLAAKKSAEMESRKSSKNGARSAPVRNEKAEDDSATRGTARRKMTYKEKREYEGIESEIEEHQKRLDEVSNALSQEAATAGYTVLADWTAEMAKLEAAIEAKTERWLELAEIAGE